MKTTLNVKRFFLDRPAVVGAVERAARVALNRAGAKTRLIAQRSMRYVTQPKKGKKPRKVSAPGQPPRAVRPHPWLRQHTYYSWDPEKQSVVVGPALFGPRSGAPRLLERGGRVRIKNKRRIVRKVGDGGELDIDAGKTAAYTSEVTTWRGETLHVRYGKLKTQAQAARANDINAWLYGPAEFEAQIEPRPFMGPALEKMLPSLPREFSHTVKR